MFSAHRVITSLPFFILVFACVNTEDSQAQVLPNAGALLQLIQRDRGPSISDTQPQVNLAPRIEFTNTTTLTVSAFHIVGNSLLTTEQLSAATADFLNRPSTFAQLQDAAAAVANTYRQAGWIVSVYLPKQEIDNGVLTLQVIEAVFGVVQIEGSQPIRVAPERILNMISQAQAQGQVLNGNAIDRVLLLLDDLPGITAIGNLKAGQLEHHTDLALTIGDKLLAAGDASLDNTGSRATGPARFTANLNLSSPLRQGDLWTATVLQTQGIHYLRLSQTVPLGHDGWRAGANASTLRYKITASEFAALDLNGSSSVFGVEASYPLLRSRSKNLYLALNAEHKNFNNLAGGVPSSQYRINVASVGLITNASDNMGGSGSTSANINLSQGKLDLNGSPNQAADALSARSEGTFTRLRYGMSRQQNITDRLSTSLVLTGQASSKNLDSAEKFYLGGINGVRAYPSNEAGGSSGQMITAELHFRLIHNIALTGFYDWGHVIVNARNDFSGAAAINTYTLKGAGVSFGWTSPFGTSLKAILARRVDGNHTRTVNGNDQDGSLIRNRIWLVASQNF